MENYDEIEALIKKHKLLDDPNHDSVFLTTHSIKDENKIIIDTLIGNGVDPNSIDEEAIFGLYSADTVHLCMDIIQFLCININRQKEYIKRSKVNAEEIAKEVKELIEQKQEYNDNDLLSDIFK
jgi:hypothetical protein